MIHPTQKILKQAWLYEIVANCDNGIDVDKFDYLQRDNYHLGMPSSFDYHRLLYYSRVIDGEICFSDKIKYAIYEMFLTRYRLHLQVYHL